LFGVFGILNVFIPGYSIYYNNINAVKYILLIGDILISLAALFGIFFWLSGKPNLIIIYTYFAYAIVAILAIVDIISMIVFHANKDAYLQYCLTTLKSDPLEYGSKSDSELNSTCNSSFQKYFIIVVLISGLHFAISVCV
ncbi:5019_t:CDS:2, partial [Dentiscutata erythropus]